MYTKSIAFLLLFFTHILGFSSHYCLDYKADAEPKITRIQMFSERCSGSNYVEKLILNNLKSEDGQTILKSGFVHKHFPPWMDLPPEYWHGREQQYTLEETDHLLFIILFRNPYDWLQSFHRVPHHALPKFWNLPFSQFIRTPWQINKKEEEVMNQLFSLNPLMDRNPENGDFFKNPIELRNAKNRNFIKIGEKVHNVYYLNYEVARDHPEEVLEEIATLFHLEKSQTYFPIIHYHGRPDLGKYQERKYPPISQEDLHYINTYLDAPQEAAIGYTLKQTEDSGT